ncbi:hypothetical protein L3Q82_013701 [Scortum barcoo]|uniref:Uncharacterized protein n=1 Tax=Scortum barcoo TaxID=214431 RepID=A0ACB8W1D6_9TELE|nr:hypothetical protein L3Q82_013701 [Scortum barcoo]
MEEDYRSASEEILANCPAPQKGETNDLASNGPSGRRYSQVSPDCTGNQATTSGDQAEYHRCRESNNSLIAKRNCKWRSPRRLTDSQLSYNNSWSPVWRSWLPPRRPRQLLHSRPRHLLLCPPRPVHLAPPEKFSGESGECRPFLVQCDLHFKNDPATFASEQAQVAFMVSHLTGKAAAWATAEWARGVAVCQNVKDFLQTLSHMFDHTSPAREASRALFSLRQRNRRVVDYAIGIPHPGGGQRVGRCGDPRCLCHRTHGGDQGSPSTDGAARGQQRTDEQIPNPSDYLDISKPPTNVHVRQVLIRLLENQLYVKAKKCDFHASLAS